MHGAVEESSMGGEISVEQVQGLGHHLIVVIVSQILCQGKQVVTMCQCDKVSNIYPPSLARIYLGCRNSHKSVLFPSQHLSLFMIHDPGHEFLFEDLLEDFFSSRLSKALYKILFLWVVTFVCISIIKIMAIKMAVNKEGSAYTK